MVRDHLRFSGTEEFNEFLTEFQAESDRAAAVLAAAYLDDVLKQLLLASFVDDSPKVIGLVENERPLGAFGARIATAYAFGLITESERFDLDQVREIRNQFAHRRHGLDFSDRSIRDRCATFKCNQEVFGRLPGVRAEYAGEPRKLFDLATALLAYFLMERVKHAARIPKAKEPAWPEPKQPQGRDERSNKRLQPTAPKAVVKRRG